MRTSHFSDQFSTQAELYQKYRPHYPEDLSRYLASLCAEHQLVWDCGTGNGQAANGLCHFFDEVIATDPSAAQISHASPHPRIRYLVETAEVSSLPDCSADLITVANALHWFDHASFYPIVRRVLKPKGIIAAWAYSIPRVSETVDFLLRSFHDKTLGSFWLPENRLVENEYRDLPFPFEQIASPEFCYQKEMNLHHLLAYLHTWSATQRFIKTHAYSPVDELASALQTCWGDPGEMKRCTWNLILKVGRL